MWTTETLTVGPKAHNCHVAGWIVGILNSLEFLAVNHDEVWDRFEWKEMSENHSNVFCLAIRRIENGKHKNHVATVPLPLGDWRTREKMAFAAHFATSRGQCARTPSFEMAFPGRPSLSSANLLHYFLINIFINHPTCSPPASNPSQSKFPPINQSAWNHRLSQSHPSHSFSIQFRPNKNQSIAHSILFSKSIHSELIRLKGQPQINKNTLPTVVL